ncbi:hypothetical protein [Desulfotruncus alcoholivorax]|uniref:hypothetical protein n=1 Tax=Desulfotruncus alcoholivorax TaxID=265477 RepID=UPI0004298B5A|nr:hypothetical protein [Desulfotruncus alcoholivorax]
MEHILAKESIKGNVRTAQDREVIINLKQKLTKLGYTPGEVEYILRNCTTNQEIIQKLKEQLDIANRCLGIK